MKINVSDSTAIKSGILNFRNYSTEKENSTEEYFDYVIHDDYKNTKCLLFCCLNYKKLYFKFTTTKKTWIKEDVKYIKKHTNVYNRAKDYCKNDLEQKR